MANVQIKYGVEGDRLAVRATHTGQPCDPPRVGALLLVFGRTAYLTAHSRCMEREVYAGPVSSLPDDWRAQTLDAIEALDAAWAEGDY